MGLSHRRCGGSDRGINRITAMIEYMHRRLRERIH